MCGMCVWYVWCACERGGNEHFRLVQEEYAFMTKDLCKIMYGLIFCAM